MPKPLTLMALALALAAEAAAGQAFWVSGKVLASVAPDGSGAQAPAHASVTLLRSNVPAEAAIQLAGPDAADPNRIFAPDRMPAYYLTDAGSQWASGISVGQSLLAVVECMAPLHGYAGPAYAGAVGGTISKPDLVSGMATLNETWLSPIPVPSLAAADTTHISLSITSFSDLGGRLSGLSIWRRSQGSAWDWQASISNPSPGNPALWDDTAVTPENLYEYSISVDFTWPGGGGAGSLSQTAGIYSTQARSLAGPFAASLKQPSPTATPAGPQPSPTPFDLPQGWLAYPNPAHGDHLSLAFDAARPGSYEVQAFNLSGELSLRHSGRIEKAGRMKLELGIQDLASGIYLMRVELRDSDGKLTELPIRKIALLR